MAIEPGAGGASAQGGPVDVVFCIDPEVYSRLWEVMRHLCVGLVDLSARVRVLSPSRAAEALTLGPIQILVHDYLVWPLQRLRMQEIVDNLSAQPPNVVHAISSESYGLAESLAQTFDAELVLLLTSEDDVDMLAEGRDGGRDGRPRHLVAASQPIEDLIHKSGKAAHKKDVNLIRPGVLAASAPTCFTRPGITPALLCTADLDDHHGVPQLIEAVRLLRDRGHELQTFFIGWGPDERRMRSLVQRYGLASLVTFARPKADTMEVMTGADIFVRPAPERALTLNTLVAVATGTAVVAVAGGVIDHCVDGKTAVLCPDGEPETLATAIERILSDPAAARTLARNGIQYMREHHSVSAMAEKTMTLYRQFLLHKRTFTLPH